MKKLLSILLIVTLLLASVLVLVPTASALEDDGTNAELEAQGYRGITALNQMSAGGKFYLKNDVTVTGSLGNYPNGAILDGNGKTITVNSATSIWVWADGATIKNLNLTGAITSTAIGSTDGANQNQRYNEGVLTKGFEGNVLLENITSDVDLVLDGGTFRFVGFYGKSEAANTLTMKNVVNKGDITVTAGTNVERLGGIIGWVGGTAKFTDCAYTGNITIEGNPSRVGGIVGVATGTAITLENCSNSGNILFNTAYAGTKDICMGGVIGLAETGNTVITGCKNSGTVQNTNLYDKLSVGGIAGKINFGVKISDCINSGAIKGGNKNGGDNIGYGGIVGSLFSIGRSDTTFEVTRCLNTAKFEVSGTAMHVAGIVGMANSVPSLTITNCLNTGEMAHNNSGAYNGTAGILGTFMCVNPAWSWSNVTKGNLTIQNCHNTGVIWGDFAAGIMGSGRELFVADSKIIVENCSNSAQINGWTVGGGIVGGYSLNNGCQFGNVTVKNCYNEGKVYANKESDPKVGDDGNAAGIVGRIWADGSCGTTTIENCANAAAVTGKWASYGILAWANHAVKIENCADSVMPTLCALSDRTNVASNNLIGAGAADKVATIKATALGQGGIPYVISEGQWTKINGLKNVYLMKDITLTSNGGNFENGTIHGQGNTITLDGAQTAIWWGNNVTVQDLVLDGTVVMNAANKTDHVGPLCLHGFSGNSVIRNVVSNVDITVDAAAGSVGGIIAKNDGTILFENVEYTGDLVLNVSTTQSFGGVIGWPKNATFKNVVNSGSMTANANSGWGKIGAIAGDINGTYTFENVVNKADLTLNAGCTSQYAGGIAGGIEPNSVVTFNNVRNEGTITSVATRQVGGIMGRACNATVMFENVENTGAIIANGRSNVGGIAGLFDYCSVIAKNIRNTGDVTVNVEQSGDHRGIGGLFGCYDGNNNAAKSLAITNAENTGDINFIKKGEGSKDVHVAGGVGRIYRAKTVTLTNIVNSGNVNYDGGNQVGWECVGGVVGGIMTYSDAAIYNITGCTNLGAVTTTGGIAGGILGGTKQLSSDKIALTIDNCVNFGDITANSGSAHAGGIAGDIGGSGNGFWNLTIKNSANSGKVFSPDGWCVGGILGQYDETGATNAATIENCINVGEVFIDDWAGRAGDPWICAGGIVGNYMNPINIKNCANTGKVATANNELFYGAFPIANTVESRSGAAGLNDLVMEGNLYLASDELMSADKYGNATVATREEIYARVAENEMRLYDANTLAQLTMKLDGYSADKWTPESYENLDAAIDEAFEVLAALEADDITVVLAKKQAPLNAAELKLRAAKANLKLVGTGVTDELKIALDNAKAEAVGGKYTTESWAAYQKALANAEALINQGNAADPAAVEQAIADLEAATDALVIGGAIRNAEDFAAMDGQEGVFTLEADITVSAPINNFKGTLIGNGHIITAESALFEGMEDAAVTDLVIIGGDIEADSLFGVAKGEMNFVVNVVVMLNSINSAVLFSDVEGVAEDVELEVGQHEVILYIMGTTVIVNDAVNGEAGLIAKAGRGVGLGLIDVMFLGDVNGKAALVGETESIVAIMAATAYSNVTGEEAVAGLVYSADVIGFMGAYFEGVLDADTTYALYADAELLDDADNAGYAYALNVDGSLVEGCDLDAIRNGEATYVMNKAFFEAAMMISQMLGIETNASDLVFVQRIGLDATPVMGKAYADNSNVVYYDEETDTYYNNVVYSDGEFAELPTPSAPLAPVYDTLNATIAKVEGIDAEDYTAETWAAVEAALEAAMDARTSRDQDEIDAALADLIYAVACLRRPLPTVEDVTVDVSGLTASIQAAEALKAEEYTAESWATVQAVLASAKATLTSSSQALVDNAKAALDAMVGGLVKKTVEAPVVIDYTKLNAAISSAEALVEANYTADTWATMQAMLVVAKSATTSSSQAAVDQAETALTRAVAGLVTAPAEAPVEEEGCGSVLSGAAVALVAVLALGAGVSFKKKED